jgi:hypothetical protein
MSDTGVLFDSGNERWPAPCVTTALPLPTLVVRNCDTAIIPPPPATWMIWAPLISFSARIACSKARAAWSWPLPGPPGTTISSFPKS